jgi:septation ring formation regulator EzrA
VAEQIPDRFREEAKEVAAEAHGAARDDKDMRSDRITAKLLDMVDYLQRDVLDHMKQEGETVRELKEGLARVEAKVAEFVSAFPAGDAVQHRLAHEAQIEDAREKKEFWAKIKFTLVALVLTAVTGWIGFVVWRAFLLGPVK